MLMSCTWCVERLCVVWARSKWSETRKAEGSLKAVEERAKQSEMYRQIDMGLKSLETPRSALRIASAPARDENSRGNVTERQAVF
jgi:hypothetical protein